MLQLHKTKKNHILQLSLNGIPMYHLKQIFQEAKKSSIYHICKSKTTTFSIIQSYVPSKTH